MEEIGFNLLCCSIQCKQTNQVEPADACGGPFLDPLDHGDGHATNVSPHFRPLPAQQRVHLNSCVFRCQHIAVTTVGVDGL